MSDAKDDLAEELDFNFSMEGDERPEAPVSDHEQPDNKRHLALFSRIPVTLTLEVASVEISLAELIHVNNDSVLELDKLAGEPLDVKVNGILFGKAEVVVVNDKYGLRIIEFNNKELGELAL